MARCAALGLELTVLLALIATYSLTSALALVVLLVSPDLAEEGLDPDLFKENQ